MESPSKKAFLEAGDFSKAAPTLGSMANDAKYREIVSRISGAFHNGLYARCSALAQEYHSLYYEKLSPRCMPCFSGYHRHPKISSWAECNQDGFVLEEFDGDGDKFFRRTDLTSQVIVSRLKCKYLAPLSAGYNRFYMEKLLIGLFSVKTTLNLRVLEQMYEKIYEEPMVNLNFAKSALDVVNKLRSPNVRVKVDSKRVTLTLVPANESSFVPMTDDETYLEASEKVGVSGSINAAAGTSHQMPLLDDNLSNSEEGLDASVYLGEPNNSENAADTSPNSAAAVPGAFDLKTSNYPLPEFLTPGSMDLSKSLLSSDAPFRFGPIPPRSSLNPQVVSPDPHLLYERLSLGHGGFGLIDMPGCSWVEAHENWRMIKTTATFFDC
jgi:hypothetical protein